MPYYLAADAGGTKTDFLLADDTRVLARTRTGSIKRMRVDAEVAMANLRQALHDLEALCGVRVSQVTRSCVGAAGNTVPLVADWIREAFDRHVSGSLLLLGDVEIALDAAFHGGPGVLVLAGTGSNVAGRDAYGVLSTCGGWGPAIADQGSGHAIGERALRYAFLAIDEGRETTLTALLMKQWGVQDLDRLIEYANAIPRPDMSRLTELVLRAAQAGDPIAREVLAHEGEAIAYLARLMLRRLHRTGSVDAEVACAGSILENVDPLRRAMQAAIASEFPRTKVLTGVIDPIEGALWRARNS